MLCFRSNKSDNEVVKKKGGGFCKLCSLSPQLQEFTGVPEMARTEVHYLYLPLPPPPRRQNNLFWKKMVIGCLHHYYLLRINRISLKVSIWCDSVSGFIASFCNVGIRLLSNYGSTLRRKICKTQAIGEISFVMNHCVPFLVSIP